MENPKHWPLLERAIAEAISKHREAAAKGLVGRSQVKAIADELRERGLAIEASAGPRLWKQEGDLTAVAATVLRALGTVSDDPHAIGDAVSRLTHWSITEEGWSSEDFSIVIAAAMSYAIGLDS